MDDRPWVTEDLQPSVFNTQMAKRSKVRRNVRAAGERREPKTTNTVTGTKYKSQPMPSITVGRGWMPSTPVSSAEGIDPGRMSQLRLTSSPWPTFTQPPSCAVWSANDTRPAATRHQHEPGRGRRSDRG